jgi:cytochrome c oxidase cbb3-type subunit 3
MAETHEKERDALSGTETTGHEWDGIKELDTPLPRWWLWTFYATIIFAVIYTILYPAWPLVHSATPGVLGYTDRTALEEAIKDNAAAQKVYTDKIAALDMDQIADDDELVQFAKAGGAAIFRNYCSQCHGSGANGGKEGNGYPNLLDDDWLWGGTRDDILVTITHGIRYMDDEDTRDTQMPAFGRDEILSKEQIAAVADYVRSLSGQGTGTEEGRTIFADNCAACHGDNGEGSQELGAPNLADAIWLYGGDRDSVIYTITNSRHGVMPAWAQRLSEGQIKEVATYVHELGGGQ